MGIKSILLIFTGVTEVEVEASGATCALAEDIDDTDERSDDMSHFAREPSLLEVKRCLESPVVTAHVKGNLCTLLLVAWRTEGT